MAKESSKEIVGDKVEQEVYETIQKILNKYNYDVVVNRNVIFRTPCIYGPRGLITYEIDILLETRTGWKAVFEVKSSEFVDIYYRFNNMRWKAITGRYSSNPVKQNRNHKLYLCKDFNLDPSRTATFEVLWGNQMVYDRSGFPHDYIVGKAQFEEQLISWLEFTTEQANTQIHSGMDFPIVFSFAENISKSEHKKNLKYAEHMRSLWRKDHKSPVYHRTSQLLCPICGAYLHLEEVNNQAYLVCDDPEYHRSDDPAFHLKDIIELSLEDYLIEERDDPMTYREEAEYYKQECKKIQGMYEDSLFEKAQLKKYKEECVELKARLERETFMNSEYLAKLQKKTAENEALQVDNDSLTVYSEELKKRFELLYGDMVTYIRKHLWEVVIMVLFHKK